ncbi:hypothetical protein AB0873_31715 [Micromonospora sp. NPDC047707]|uniref:hypothetical protein n=1 Tax=Micromonospora sp. NPDC047707 TaxID=3154498 RepID=UPI0034516E68
MPDTLYDWAVASLPGTGQYDFARWLLIRRSITNPDELAHYLCHGPTDTSDEELIRVAGIRWATRIASRLRRDRSASTSTRSAATTPIDPAMCAHAFLAVTDHYGEEKGQPKER